MTLGFQNSLAVVQTIEQHLQQRSPLHTHCSASSAVTKAESNREILDMWLPDTQHCNGFQTGGSGGDKNVVRCTMWENKLWQSSYVSGKCTDGSQALKYADLNVIPQAGGLDEPLGEFAFSDCFLHLKQHMLKSAKFGIGDCWVSLPAKLPLQLATIDTTLAELQNPNNNMDHPFSCLQQRHVPIAASARARVEKLLLNVKQCKRAICKGCDSSLVLVIAAAATAYADALGTVFVTSSASPLVAWHLHHTHQTAQPSSTSRICFYLCFRTFTCA